MKRVEKILYQAKAQGLIIRFRVPYAEGTWIGFVVDIGPKFFLLELLDDSFGFEQFTCMRIRDISKLQCPATNSAFFSRARKALGHKRVRPPKLDMKDAATILGSVKSPLVSIHADKLSPGTCAIGEIISVTRKEVTLREIDTDATWENEHTYYKLKPVTRIDLPGPYERALLAAAMTKPDRADKAANARRN